MDTFEKDFETHLKYAEEYIANGNWEAASKSLGSMLATICYGGLRIKDRARYNSLLRIVIRATGADSDSEIEDNFRYVDETSEEVDYRLDTYDETMFKLKKAKEKNKKNSGK